MSLPILIFIAIFALTILILVHEIGHFVAAKLVGIWPEEFGIGLPPRVWGKKVGETIYSINALPVGGFVRLHGEDPQEKAKYPDRSFQGKSPLARIFVAVAGVFMNFVLAIVFFAIIFGFTGIPKGVKTVEVASESPAAAAGIEKGDEFLSVDGIKIDDNSTFPILISEKAGKEITVKIKTAEGKVVEKQIIVRSQPPKDEGLLGIVYAPVSIYRPPTWQAPFVYTYYAAVKTIDFSGKILAGIGMIFGSLLGGQVPAGVAGPFGVTAITAEVARLGMLPLMEFMAIISINLGLINLMPFPPLDGGRILFIAVEGIFGKKVLPRAETIINTAGLVILVGLMIIITASEIPALLSAGSLSAFVEGLIQ